MNIFQRNLHKLFFVFSLVVAPLASFAEGEAPPPCPISGKICNPINANSIPDLIQKILEGVIKIGIPIIALAIIYCGFLFVAARGNSEKITKAKDALLYTLIGSAVLLGSWAIAQIISETVSGLSS